MRIGAAGLRAVRNVPGWRGPRAMGGRADGADEGEVRGGDAEVRIVSRSGAAERLSDFSLLSAILADGRSNDEFRDH